LPLNRHSATTATYVYDCKITAWCLHEPVYTSSMLLFPRPATTPQGKLRSHTRGGESSVNKSPSVIRRYSHLQSHRRNEYLSNICLEERLGANDNPWERVFEGSVANSRSGHIRCSDRLSLHDEGLCQFSLWKAHWKACLQQIPSVGDPGLGFLHGQYGVFPALKLPPLPPLWPTP
jgi:hypothetical protein